MKKILFLGAAKFQTPPIEYAHAQGMYVITADNNVENVGHRIAHKSFNVSTTDFAGIMEIARSERIDGIMTFGSDVSVGAVAAVREELRLPCKNDYSSYDILCDKGKFRSFLDQANLQKHFYAKLDIDGTIEAEERLPGVKFPVVIKPVDSSGSKGVHVVNSIRELERMAPDSLKYSIGGEIIVESFIAKKGMQICGDGFMFNGNVAFIGLGDGHFHDNPEGMAPYAETFPSTHSQETLEKVADRVGEILLLCGYHNGPFNLDVWLTQDGEVFVNEIGPRNGGNYIPSALKHSTGFDMVRESVEQCICDDYSIGITEQVFYKNIACFMVHSLKGGRIASLGFDAFIEERLLEVNRYLKDGEDCHPFINGRHSIGNIILEFDSFATMQTEVPQLCNRVRLELI